MASKDTLSAALDEAKELLKRATQPLNASALTSHIKQLEMQLASLAPEPVQPPADSDEKTAAPSAPLGVSKHINWEQIPTFYWEQSSESVKVVCRGLDGVKDIPIERVSVQFTESSLDLRVVDLNGKNYSLSIPQLSKNIVPTESSFKVKKNKVVLSLAKEKSEYGVHDTWTELAAKKRKRQTNAKDPTAGLMDMMRDMYDEGDDQMKKVIGESMMKAQQSRMAGGTGMGGMDDDFGV